MNSTLLNFQCPNYLKSDIDLICRFRRISRTALINILFERVVEEWKPKIKQTEQSHSTLPSKVETSNWNVSSPSVPVTDYNQPLAIFANSEPNNDW